MNRLWLLLISLVATLWVAAPAAAQTVVTVTEFPAGTAPVLGSVLRGTAASTFSISTGGVVTETSGDAVRMVNTPVTAPVFVVSCTGSLLCATNNIRVTIAIVPSTSSASITLLRVANLTGITFFSAAPTPASSITFDLWPIGLGGPISFTVGMDVLLAANAASGTSNYSFTVTATRL